MLIYESYVSHIIIHSDHYDNNISNGNRKNSLPVVDN